MVVDQLMQYFSGPKFREDVEQGKARFFEGAGILDEESQDYENKMIQFSHWYLFSRRLIEYHKTPIEAYEEFNDLRLDTEVIENIKNVRSQRHSLFEVLKVSGDYILVKDMFSGYKIKVLGVEFIQGFNKGDIIESRVIPKNDSFYFAGSFCFHPPEAKKFIKKEVKVVNKLPVDQQDTAREDLIFRLFKMNSKYVQYTHVPLNMIYTNEGQLKF